ncbi:response regulator [Sporosarcina sp. FSL W7-1349]|uniref:response regulator n=1 Tax=Sporosarcina sp. FSL W7-1349 TaxID=2921561 RepID=UPI0030F5E63D
MKAILIDDEPLALQFLEHQLTKVADIEIVGAFTDPFAGQKAVEENEIDLVFLDIEMPQMNGIDLAGKIIERKPQIHIVFVTAYDVFAIQAFELNALDYVLKPVQEERILKTIERIEQRRLDAPESVSQAADPLRLNLFQQVSISIGGQTLAPFHWRTSKVQQLFFYFIHYKGRVISKSEIIELLWPDLDIKKAYAQLYTAIYHIRKTVEPISDYFIITSTSEGYLMTLENVELDVDEFERIIHSSVPLSAETIGDYEQALDLYKGEYLADSDYVWAENERHRLQLLWIRTSLQLLNWYDSTKDWEKAMQLGLALCDRMPLEEEAHFTLMKVFAEVGNRVAVHSQYSLLQEILMRELGLSPNRSVTEWYEGWKGEHKE